MGRARTLHILSIASACGGLGCVAGAAVSSAAGGAAPCRVVRPCTARGVAAGCGRAAFRSRRRTSDRRTRPAEAAAAAAARELKVRLGPGQGRAAARRGDHLQHLRRRPRDRHRSTSWCSPTSRPPARSSSTSPAPGTRRSPSCSATPRSSALIRDMRQSRTGTGRRVVEHQVNTPGGRRTFKITLSLPAAGPRPTAGDCRHAATAEMTAAGDALPDGRRRRASCTT